MKEALDALGKSEGLAVKIYSYFLMNNSKDVYKAQVVPVTCTKAIYMT